MVLIDAPSSLATELLGTRSKEIVQDIQNRLSRFATATGNCEAAVQAISNFNSIVKGEVFKKVQAIKNKYNRVFKSDDAIIRLNTVSEVQSANRRMIPFLMSNTMVKEYAQNGNISAYGEDYNRHYLNRVEKADPYWRASVSGMARVIPNEDTESEETKMKVSIFYNERVDPLTLLEKMNIRSAWNLMEQALEEDIDPTSLDNAPVM